ncbi:DUF624 domain-containing protein [Microbacterium sp. HD4P20]|uniref:YesL family protein n=1 Tax=Microbacterium sp. HD4P20 TaxID=2864874 RepID=UPI001C63DDF8|nr:DUF624 domain-containing protein [Microbacterium sp. HD4P20]MCP2635969.1 DUF624 domain-containing protein [Microbacterium sp. HD4P20]
MSANAATPGWAVRAHAAFEWVWWLIVVNVLWYLFALAGGVVLGAVPASVAAAELTRRRLRGESFPPLRAFAAAWRREFWRSNAALGPAFAVTALLAASVIGHFNAAQPLTAWGLASAGAFVGAFAVSAIAVPMYVHYDLPLSRYVITASRWMLRNLAHAVLLVAASVLVVTCSLVVPGIIPFLSLGAWSTLATVLCLGFFAANERRLAPQTSSLPSPQNEGVPR